MIDVDKQTQSRLRETYESLSIGKRIRSKVAIGFLFVGMWIMPRPMIEAAGITCDDRTEDDDDV